MFAAGDRAEKRVPMTRLRAKIAERLVEAQSSMAMLTTFNEVDMHEVMALRSKYKDLFEKTHNGVRLGFMSFFVKAAVEALKRFPAVNASIDGNDIVYHGYQDIGVAVSSDRGLVVPVRRPWRQLQPRRLPWSLDRLCRYPQCCSGSGRFLRRSCARPARGWRPEQQLPEQRPAPLRPEPERRQPERKPWRSCRACPAVRRKARFRPRS